MPQPATRGKVDRHYGYIHGVQEPCAAQQMRPGHIHSYPAVLALVLLLLHHCRYASTTPRGFYRGFGTVVFGTIPARTVYMTSLEVTKAAVMRLGDRFDVTPAALAGAASFAGGAAASASTQAVVIPIDVISQRLMMHGVTTTTNNSTTSTSTTSTSSSASGSRGSNGVQQGQQQQRSYWTAASSSSRGTSHHAGTTAAASRSGTGTPSTTTADAAAHMQQLHSRGHHTSCQHAANTAAEAGSRQHLQQLQQPLQGQRLAQGLSQFTGSSGSSGGNGSSSSSRHFDLRPRHLSGAAAAAAVQQPVNGYQMARLIVQQEGIRGLYRGFWPSIATFVPQSSLWWGSYGFWQRTIWEQLPTSLMQAGSSSRSGSSSSGDGDGGSSSGSSGAASTGVVVAVQTSAAVLAGCSSTILTNPLDLVKTRLQVRGQTERSRQCMRSMQASTYTLC